MASLSAVLMVVSLDQKWAVSTVVVKVDSMADPMVVQMGHQQVE